MVSGPEANIPDRPTTKHVASTELVTVGTWDSMPSKWEIFGRANLTPKRYDMIITPHLEDLKNGIITYEFLDSPKFSSPNRTFHPFPLLPLELRRKIWQHAIADQSNPLRVGFRYELQELEGHKARLINRGIQQLSRVSPLLNVCTELSEAVRDSKEWKVIFKSNGHPEGMAFNIKNDRLFLHLKNTSEYPWVRTLSFIHCPKQSFNSLLGSLYHVT